MFLLCEVFIQLYGHLQGCKSVVVDCIMLKAVANALSIPEGQRALFFSRIVKCTKKLVPKSGRCVEGSRGLFFVMFSLLSLNTSFCQAVLTEEQNCPDKITMKMWRPPFDVV